MPLSKQAKALYEAALRRKGLPLRRMQIEHVTPNTYGPFPEAVTPWGYMAPKSYWNSTGRYQDLEDELAAAAKSGRYERPGDFNRQYRRWYNDGDLPSGILARMPSGLKAPVDNYRESPYSYTYNRVGYETPGVGRYGRPLQRKRRKYRELTELGEREMEAIADQQVVEEYKDYLRRVYEGELHTPPRYGVKVFDEFTHRPLVSEYDNLDDALKGLRRNREDYGSAYLEEIWPE